MKTIKSIALLLISFSTVLAQQAGNYAQTDKIALAIPAAETHTSTAIAAYINAHFTTDGEKVRAIFVWIAANISYDVSHRTSGYTTSEQPLPDDVKVADVLKNRVGICDHYSTLFTDLCHKVGLKAYVVGGYDRKGEDVAHAWNVVMVNNKWQLIDATWGAGATKDNHFVAKLNDDYFLPDPKTFITDHMPFDYMWQLLPHPLTFPDFTAGITSPSVQTPYFAYADSIAAWEQLSDMEQHEAEERRLSRNRPDSRMLSARLNWVREYISINKRNEEVIEQNRLIDIYNDAVRDLNNCIEHLNEFAAYRSKKFRPAKPDIEIQRMLDTAGARLAAAKKKAESITGKNQETDKMVRTLNKPFPGISRELTQHQVFLKKYLSKPNPDRAKMFD